MKQELRVTEYRMIGACAWLLVKLVKLVQLIGARLTGIRGWSFWAGSGKREPLTSHTEPTHTDRCYPPSSPRHSRHITALPLPPAQNALPREIKVPRSITSVLFSDITLHKHSVHNSREDVRLQFVSIQASLQNWFSRNTGLIINAFNVSPSVLLL